MFWILSCSHLGFSAFTAEFNDSTALATFFKTLQDALSELGTAYDKLLNSLESMLAGAFRLEETGENLRIELATRAEPLLEVVIETQLKGFLIHLYSEGHDFKGWIESIGTFLAKKPPTSWIDTDKAQFEINLSQLSRKFRHFEAVSYEKINYGEPDTETMRIGITTPNEYEQERVVKLTDEEQTEKIEQAIAKVFKDFELDEKPEIRLAVLARITKNLMHESEQ